MAVLLPGQPLFSFHVRECAVLVFPCGLFHLTWSPPIPFISCKEKCFILLCGLIKPHCVHTPHFPVPSSVDGTLAGSRSPTMSQVPVHRHEGVFLGKSLKISSSGNTLSSSASWWSLQALLSQLLTILTRGLPAHLIPAV